MFGALVLCALAVVFLGFLFTLRGDGKAKNLPPGPYRWPLIGNVVEIALANINHPHLAMKKLADKYGDIMIMGFGVHHMVVISSYELIKELLSKTEVSERFVFPFVPDRAYGKANMGIIWNSGEAWQELRRYTIRTLRDFGFGKSSSMEIVMQEEVEEFISVMKSKIDKETGHWEVDSATLALSTVNILWSLVAGQRFHLTDKRLHKMMHLNDKVLEAVGYNNRYTPFPIIKKIFPKWSRYEEHMRCYEELQEFVREIIENIRKERAQRKNPEAENFIETFLDQIDNKDNTNVHFTEEQLIVVLMDLFLAGSETTGNSLNWTLMYLALNPDIQRKMYEEVVYVVGADGHVCLNHNSRMPYTQATILETLRFSNAVPIPPPRKVTADINVRGYFIPKDTGIMVNNEAILKDVKYWGDPHTYRPERFLKVGDDGVTTITNTERVVAFGFGKRICLGDTLAQNALFLYIPTLVQNFEFSIIPEKEPSVIPQPGMTLVPYKYSLKVRSRK